MKNSCFKFQLHRPDLQWRPADLTSSPAITESVSVQLIGVIVAMTAQMGATRPTVVRVFNYFCFRERDVALW